MVAFCILLIPFLSLKCEHPMSQKLNVTPKCQIQSSSLVLLRTAEHICDLPKLGRHVVRNPFADITTVIFLLHASNQFSDV